MRILSYQQLIWIHGKILETTKGSPGLRDSGRIEAALARPFSAHGNSEFYPTLKDKATALVHSLIKDHPFVEGNKRTAVTVAGVFLDLNGYVLLAPRRI